MKSKIPCNSGDLAYISLEVCSLFLLGICSIDWTNEKDKKISELEKQAVELKNTWEKIKSNNILDLQIKCREEAKNIPILC